MNPTPQQVQTVIDNLEQANKIAEYDAPIDMFSTYITNYNVCGTPMCHGGWYALVTKCHRYSEGASAMAEHLGFDDRFGLMDWAEKNPTIWGNKSGGYMFSDGSSFNQPRDSGFTLQTIIDHWKQVKTNLEKAQ